MPEKEYIEREAIAKHIDQSFGEVSTPFVVREIRNFPTADVAEVRHGEWITDEKGFVTCSECGEEHTWDDFSPPYCDMCGAKMDGGKNG